MALAEFAYNNSYQASIGMPPFEALYGRPCISPLYWDESGDRAVMSPDFVRACNEKIPQIRQRLLTAQSRQKSYADNRRRPLEFAVGDLVFLRISPTRGVVKFGRRNKLSPWFIGPFEILQRVGECAYRLALPPALSGVHDVFHVSILRKYIPDPSHMLDYSQLELDDRLTVEECVYRLALPPTLSGVHDVFHVSLLMKYISNPSHRLDYS